MNNLCSQCGQKIPICLHCGEKIIFVPKAGFGNTGVWRHLELPKIGPVGSVWHEAHPSLHIT